MAHKKKKKRPTKAKVSKTTAGIKRIRCENCCLCGGCRGTLLSDN